MFAEQSLTMNAVAENVDVSRPAISKYVRVLTECGLVAIKQQGRERFCEVKPESLTEAVGRIEPYCRFWTKS